MKLSIQSLARKLSLPSPKRTWSGGRSNREGAGGGAKRAMSRSEAASFASASSSSSSEDTLLMARSTPRSVLPAEISRRELEAVLRRLGHEAPSDDELDAVAAIAAEAEGEGAGEEDELREAFKVFDADGDGRITAEELRGVMVAILGGDAEGCSLDDCRRMIGGVDADGDGFVGFQDFARMMMAATAAAAATDGPRPSW
ncbi:probable calcium-binding protein CML35 [Oryza brachyantha]|uniref:EF-hand domain-containing protein n=1 Tax=Oryza brachyantha TaxID=4533 RepID=J3L7U5_ORYBR|nr:probable calcium-binding protein CML35 [Oryza brachyantha]